MILIFVSSLNENVKLAQKLQEQLKNNKFESKIINLVELNLPLYDTNKEQNDGIPQKALDLSQEMKSASGYLFVTAEYNYNVPPVLVNTIAWVSRIGDDFRELFALKRVQLATHSGSNGVDLLNSLRNQFTRLGSIVMPREIITSYTNPLKEDSSKRILEQFTTFIKE